MGILTIHGLDLVVTFSDRKKNRIKIMGQLVLLLVAFHGVLWSGAHGYPSSREPEVLYITGGQGPGGRLSSTEVLDITDSTCTRSLGDLPVARVRHSMTMITNSVLVCGGYDTPRSCISTTTPADNNAWVHSTTTRRRAYHSGVSLGGEIHLLGGFYSDNTREVYRNASWQKEDLPFAIGYDSCSVVVNDHHIVVIGGVGHMNKARVLDTTTGQWTELQDMPGGRRFHACVRMGNTSIVATGGYDEEYNRTRTTYRLDIEDGGRWTELGEMTTERSGHQAANIDGRMVVLGGYDGGNRLDSVEEMDEEGNWGLLPGVRMKTPRYWFSAVMVRKSLVCP